MYLGADFGADDTADPSCSEGNARPGLNIQLANRRGLLPRLRFLDEQPSYRLLQLHRRRELMVELSEL